MCDDIRPFVKLALCMNMRLRKCDGCYQGETCDYHFERIMNNVLHDGNIISDIVMLVYRFNKTFVPRAYVKEELLDILPMYYSKLRSIYCCQ